MAERSVDEVVCDLSTSLLVTSGAGCGKTYRMVQRYAALIEAGVPVERIIAVTFTEKAAAELRDRVRDRCRERMARAEGDARERWQRAARRLAAAPVSTIHGLCSRLLRENAISAGVDPRFGTLDETEQALLLHETVRETLLDRVHDGTDSARQVVARYGLQDACSVLRALLRRREELRDLLGAPPAADDLLRRWSDAIDEARRHLLAEILGDDRWSSAVSELAAVDTVPGDTAGDRQRDVLALAMRAADAQAPLHGRISAVAELFGTVSRHRCGSKKKWDGRLDDLERVRDAFCALADVKDEYRDAVEGLDRPEDEDTARLAAAICTEGSVALDAWQRARDERSALDFDDLQIMARDLLAEHPDVLERVRSRYSHVLVDEFQDTNALQKEIIWLIAGGDPRSEHPPGGGRLFVVGDAKQSIYGFRNADVTVFSATVKQFAAAGEGCDTLSLSQSRRSHPALVDFHNCLFGHDLVMGDEPGEPWEAVYEPLEAWREPLDLPHDVELLLASAEEGDEELSARHARMREAELLAARIRDIVDTGALTVEVREGDEVTRRPAKWRDFGMLFQSMSSVGLYEYALRREDIPFYTSAGRGFYNRQEVRDCLSLLSVLENAADDLSLLGALRSPMFAVSDDAIFWLTRTDDTLYSAIGRVAGADFEHHDHLREHDVAAITRAHEVISGLRADRDTLSLSELVERMLAQTGLAAVQLSQFAGRQAAANLDKLTDLARSFEERGEFGLRTFIGYLHDLVTREYHEGMASVVEEGEDVVKLMTVHKAKGLEWPVVVIPDMGWRGPGGRAGPVALSAETGPVPRVEMPDGDRQWGAVGEMIRRHDREREEAERRRLLYVALTRARDHLILSSSYALSKKGELKAGPWLQWLTDGLGIEPDDFAEGLDLSRGKHTCVLCLPEPSSDHEAGPGASERAPLTVLDDVMAAAKRQATGELPSLVRPVSHAGHSPRRLSVTAARRYEQCPRMFELCHVLGLPEIPPRTDWLGSLGGAALGTLAHRMLEIIGREGLDDEDAVENALRTATFPGGIAEQLDPDDRERLIRAVRWFLHDAAPDDDPDLLVYRGWIADGRRLRSEVQFTAPMAGVLIEGQIDALSEDADGRWRILDYKTGTAARRLGGYRFQIGLYCAAVEQITGQPPADAALAMLEARRIERLDPISEAAEARRRLDRIVANIRDGRFERAEDCPGGACPLAHACELT